MTTITKKDIKQSQSRNKLKDAKKPGLAQQIRAIHIVFIGILVFFLIQQASVAEYYLKTLTRPDYNYVPPHNEESSTQTSNTKVNEKPKPTAEVQVSPLEPTTAEAEKEPRTQDLNLSPKDSGMQELKLSPLKTADLEQFTVRVSTWKRARSLRAVVDHLTTCESVAQVQIVWRQEQGAMPDWLVSSQANANQQIVVEQHSDSSAHAKFDIQFDPPTTGVLLHDDDLIRPCEALNAGFAVWSMNPDRIVGYNPKRHLSKKGDKQWSYGYQKSLVENQYSFVLTDHAFVHRDYLRSYFQEMPTQIRKRVVRDGNCEDIALSFWVASKTDGKVGLLADKWAGQRSEIRMHPIPAKALESGPYTDARSACVNDFADILQLKDKLQTSSYEQPGGPGQIAWLQSGAPNIPEIGNHLNNATDPKSSTHVKKLLFRRKKWAAQTNWTEFNKDIQQFALRAGKDVKERGLCYFQEETCHRIPAVVAGLARSTSEIKKDSWKLLMDLSCNHSASVHIIVAEDSKDSPRPGKDCAPFLVELQDNLLKGNLSDNRVVRLAQLRDAQRNRIREIFFTESSKSKVVTPAPLDKESSMILIDLDLAVLPSAAEIMERVLLQAMKHRTDPQATHLICSAGNHISKHNRKQKLFYYDTFATLFYPDTFAYPLYKRVIPKYIHGEDPAFIPVHENLAKPEDFTQFTMMELFRREARMDPDGLYPMRSCFGGVAFYKSDTWLTPQCQYTLPESEKEAFDKMTSVEEKHKTIFRYASSKIGQPCEHIVLHNCLHRKIFHTDVFSPEPLPRPIAIDGYLLTQWLKTPKVFYTSSVSAKKSLYLRLREQEQLRLAELYNNITTANITTKG